MNRRYFLQSTMFSPYFLTAPNSFTFLGRESEGFLVKAGEGRYHGTIQNKVNPANTIQVKVSGQDTNDELAIFEQTGLATPISVPLHVHFSQDEIFLVQEGEYLFQVDQIRYNWKKGDTIFLPRKVPHAWTQLSKQAKTTVIVQPAGQLEAFFLKLSHLSAAPTREHIASLFEVHQMKIVGPPISIP